MDTLVIASDLPIVLLFIDRRPDEVIGLWHGWVKRRCLVLGRYRDEELAGTAVGLMPCAIASVQFVPHEPNWPATHRSLWLLPHLSPRPDPDLAPEDAHYWTLVPEGYAVIDIETRGDGTDVLVLDQWEFGRI